MFVNIGLYVKRVFMYCVCMCRIVLGSSGGSSCKQARVPGQGHLSRTDTGLFRTPICTGATVPPGRRHGQSVHSLAECQTQCRPSVAGTEALSAEQSLAPSCAPVVIKLFLLARVFSYSVFLTHLLSLQ